MLKSIGNMLVGAVICAAVSAALAVTGQVPVNGFQTPDGTWLLGLSGGVNNTYQSGITAAGTTQATATALPSGIYLMEVDTTPSSSGVALPTCVPGTEFNLYNNGANTLTVYPAVANDPVTGAQATINSNTTLSGGLATHVPQVFSCAKSGVWSSK